jgi:hypothetical protein
MLTYQDHLTHLIVMANMPGAKAHAWHRAKELDADQSGMWTGIAADLERAMRSQKSVAEAPESGD